MLPVIALVGRPNVGKSTLFNRLTRTRDALVADYPGLTRDRKYGEGEYEGRRYMVIDTGGITGNEVGLDWEMASQSLQAMDEADIIFLMVDAREGLCAVDEEIARMLRQKSCPVVLVVNKIDGVDPNIALADFYRLGMDEPFAITATHGRGVASLLKQALKQVPDNGPDSMPVATGIKIAVVGRPNVGKSTLVNRLLGEQRVVVFDQPGTTRDSIYINYERAGKHYTLIDTAGIRRRKNVKLMVEKFSIVKTLQAIDDANVVVLLVDAHEALVEQDLHLMGYAIEAGRALVIAVNKWDGLEQDRKDWLKQELKRRLRFVEFADIHFISALHGTGVGHLYKSILAAYKAATDSLSTNRLTTILEDAVNDHPPPLARGRRIKLRYAHAGGRNPPVIVIHGSQTHAVPGHYSRYLEKTFRKVLGLHGTPVKIEYRSGDNPYAGRGNKLTARQISKKRRLMRHVKKKR
ncbi:MAG: ribosome biogenesis GTPase Der [Gammaproteobacteria bacterium]|nr:MAG: ribosome biogenesis GTPase Der [Gammaproteobacteria bacterium]RLA51531.1 MAG: ribosome biogenesis GTPase Der [Gammaproteobacteria bacterium]